jgi:hypothetical protein
MRLKRNFSVEADPEVVFRHLTEGDLLQRWVPKFSNFMYTSHHEGELPGVGSTFSYKTENTRVRGKVLEWEGGRRYKAQFNNGSLQYTDLYIIEGLAGKTRIRGEMHIQMDSFVAKLFVLVFWWLIWMVSMSNMRSLKKAVEGYDADASESSEAGATVGKWRQQYSFVGIEEGFILRRYWREKYSWIIFPFAAIWFFIGWLMFGESFKDSIWPMGIHLFAFLIWFPVLGGLTYLAIAMQVNKTDLKLTPGELSVRHYPLPWMGAKRIDPAMISGMRVATETRTDKHGGTHVYYRLHYNCRDGSKGKLLGNFTDRAEAEWIRKELMKVLG